MSGAGKETTSPVDRSSIGYTSGAWPSKDGVAFHDHNAHFGELPASLVELATSIGPALPSGMTVLGAIQWLDALISRLETHTQRVYGFSLDAVITDLSRSFLLDAVIRRSMASSVALDAILSRPQAGSATLDSILLGFGSGSFSLDAYLSAIPSHSFVLDAVLRDVRSGTLSLDAVLFLSRTASATLDAIMKRVQSGSLALDAVVLKGRTGSMTLDAYILASFQSFTLDAKIQKDVTYRPTSDQSKSGTTYSSGTDAWALVDESTLNTADYFENKVANGWTYMGITPGTHPSSEIKRITINWVGTNGAPAFAFSLGLRDPSTGTQYPSSADSVTIGQNVTSGSWPRTTRPWDNAAWTTTDIDNLQFGVIAPSSLPKIRAQQMWVVVRYY